MASAPAASAAAKGSGPPAGANPTAYLADIADYAAQNEIYASKFEAPFPARSAFQVAALPAGGLVEIEVVAAL